MSVQRAREPAPAAQYAWAQLLHGHGTQKGAGK